MILERAGAESRILRWLRSRPLRRLTAAMFRPLTRRLPFLTRDIQRPRGDDAGAPLEIVEGSVVAGAMAAAVAMLGRAAGDSLAGRAVRAAAGDFGARPLAARIRLTSTMLLAAVVTHVAMTRFDAPAPVFAARAAWAAIAAMLAFGIAAAPAIAAAWRDRQ